jgi:tetratricopeptide (TPR) repeat protein
VSCYVRAMSVGFASPEQLNGEALSTLADIYSLGKILAASLSQTKPSKLQHKELTAIVSKATASEPSQRYVSAHELQQDLLAILGNVPISAYKNSASYRVRKLFVRQPWGTGFALSFAFGVIGFAVTVWHHNKTLEVERQIAEQTSSFMVDVFSSASPESYDNNPISARDLLWIAKNKLDKFDSSPAIQQRLQLELASALIGVGDFKTAIDLLDKIPSDSALYINKELLKASVLLSLSELDPAVKILGQFEPTDLSSHSRLKYYLARANIAHYRGKFDESLKLLANAESVALEIKQNSDLITIYDYKAANYLQLGNYAEQLNVAKKSVDLAKTNFGEESMQMQVALHSLQGALANAEEYSESGKILDRVLALKRKLYPANHPQIALTLNELGSNFTSMQQYQKAIEYHQEAIALIETRFGQKHIDYVYGNAYLGNAHGFLQQHDQAIAAHQKSLTASTHLYGADNLMTLNAMSNLGRAYHEKGDHQTARQLLEPCLKLARTQFEENSIRIALYKANYGSILLALNEPDPARKNLAEALEVMKQTIGESHNRYQRTLETFNKIPKL